MLIQETFYQSMLRKIVATQSLRLNSRKMGDYYVVMMLRVHERIAQSSEVLMVDKQRGLNCEWCR